MLKLIASDIDGTLIPYGETVLPERLFPLIRRLKAAGVLFCPASGRQYHSMRRLFAPVADEICFLCENGAILYSPGAEETAPVLAKTPMPRSMALDLARDILALPGCQLLVSGANTSYICACPPDYMALLRENKGNRVTVLTRPEEIPEAILKVSAYCPQGTERPAAALSPRWGQPFHMAAASPDWLDFGLADKGSGLRRLCAGLGISLDHTAAFGDNWNDLSLLEAAGRAWVMEHAHPDLLARFPHHCASVPAVLDTLWKELEA